MRQRRLTAAVLSAVAGIAVAALLTGTAHAAETAPRTNPPATQPVTTPSPTTSPSSGMQLSGRITAVDPKAGTVTAMVSLNGRDTALTFTVTGTTKILVNGVPATLAALPVNVPVQLSRAGDGAPLTIAATVIPPTPTAKPTPTSPPAPAVQPGVPSPPAPAVQPGVLGGAVVAVDAKARTVSVKVATGTRTWPVTADARITLDGATVALAAVPVNATVSLGTADSATGQVVNRIEATRVKPTEPTIKPTEPTIKPTEPTAKPTEPTAKPTEPTAKPTEPTIKPTEPTAKPTVTVSVRPAVSPTVRPVEPTAKASPNTR
jgi:hypothetical protein